MNCSFAVTNIVNIKNYIITKPFYLMVGTTIFFYEITLENLHNIRNSGIDNLPLGLA